MHMKFCSCLFHDYLLVLMYFLFFCLVSWASSVGIGNCYLPMISVAIVQQSHHKLIFALGIICRHGQLLSARAFWARCILFTCGSCATITTQTITEPKVTMNISKLRGTAFWTNLWTSTQLPLCRCSQLALNAFIYTLRVKCIYTINYIYMYIYT